MLSDERRTDRGVIFVLFCHVDSKDFARQFADADAVRGWGMGSLHFEDTLTPCTQSS